jgi:hypothetical protein
LLYITKLVKIEEEIKSLSREDKFNLRLEKAKPILDELHSYLIAMQPRTLPKSPLGQAVSYTLNQWPKFLTYFDDGRLEIITIVQSVQSNHLSLDAKDGCLQIVWQMQKLLRLFLV